MTKRGADLPTPLSKTDLPHYEKWALRDEVRALAGLKNQPHSIKAIEMRLKMAATLGTDRFCLLEAFAEEIARVHTRIDGLLEYVSLEQKDVRERLGRLENERG